MFGIDDVLIGAGISAAGSLIGGSMKNDSAEKIAQQNIAMQREFAQNGVQWKVADARKAGISPLAALGANTSTFSNVVGGEGMGDSIADASQDIGRAVAATKGSKDREGMVENKANELKLKNMDLQNQLLGAQIAKLTAPAHVGPPMPTATNPSFIDGQGNTPSLGIVKMKPSEINPGSPDNLGAEPGVGPDVNWARTADGGYAPQPSMDAMKRQSNDTLGMIGWNLRNRLSPSLSRSLGVPPPDYLLPKGKVWEYNVFKQAWYPIDPDWLHK